MKREDRKKESHTHICDICGQDVYPEDEQEYVKTRRGTELWMHRRCVQRRNNCGGNKKY